MAIVIHTSQNVALEYEPASLGDRILATLIDYLIFLAWAIAIGFLIRQVPTLTQGNNTFVLLGLFALPLMLYDLLCEVFLNGQSLGKIAVKIRVVSLDGSQPRLGAYMLRWLLRLIESPFFLGGIVGLIAIAVSNKGQRVGDIAAGTTVVKLTRPVTLDQVTHRTLPEDYAVTFPQVGQLSDRDIHVIREALRRNNPELVTLAADKVKEVIGVQSEVPDEVFLRTLIQDYQFLATQ